MKNLKLMVAAATLIGIGMTGSVGPAAADILSPWEKFCLNTSSPGQDLGNCLDGLPSGGGGSAVIKTAPGGVKAGVQTRTKTKSFAPRRLKRR